MALTIRAVSRALGGFKPCAASAVRLMSSSANTAATDAKAIEIYKNHPEAFCNIPIDSIKFEVVEHFIRKDEKSCLVYIDNGEDKKLNGVKHVSPFAVTLFNFFGPTGNLGRIQDFGTGIKHEVKNALEANHEFGLSARPLACQEEVNDLVVEYYAWIDAIELKLCEHLLENASHYPAASDWLDRIGSAIAEGQRAEMLRTSRGQPFLTTVRSPKDSNEDLRKFIPIRQRVYSPAASAPVMQSPPGPHDQMAAEGDGMKVYQRRHVPMYDIDGNEIPIPLTAGSGGDVFSCNFNLTVKMFRVGANSGIVLNKNLRSIFRLRQQERTNFKANPFAGASFA